MEEIIICNAMTADGEICGQTATVLDTRPVYAAKMYLDESGEFQTAVLGTEFEIECPTCGRRMQTVSAD